MMSAKRVAPDMVNSILKTRTARSEISVGPVQTPPFTTNEFKLCENLGIASETLEALFQKRWLLSICRMYRNDVLQRRHEIQGLLNKAGSIVLPSVSNISIDTIEQAAISLCMNTLDTVSSIVPMPELSQRCSIEQRARFDIKFLEDLVRDGRTDPQLWMAYQDQGQTYSLCRKAACFLTWLLKTYASSSSWRSFFDREGTYAGELVNNIHDSMTTTRALTDASAYASSSSSYSGSVELCSDEATILGSRSRTAIESVANRSTMPHYETPQSRETPGQQRAVDWMTSFGRTEFERRYQKIAKSWGLAATHSGTCLLVSQSSRALSAKSFIQRFDASRCQYPEIGETRHKYKWKDHTTNFSRAAAWFNKPQRSGIDLDIFLGCVEYKTFDGSHLCHHGHCINPSHICYELSSINTSRNDCKTNARVLRKNGSEVPKQCSKHQPPCLLQHAALKTVEAYMIQFDVFMTATGTSRLILPKCSAKHRFPEFPTFESRLPLQFLEGQDSAVFANKSDLVQPEADLQARPVFSCQCCDQPKHFERPSKYWSHLVRIHHRNTNEELLLAEIVRSAHEWWNHIFPANAGNAETLTQLRDPTLSKIREIIRQGDHFRWSTVHGWFMA